jgi:hypothetical protein
VTVTTDMAVTGLSRTVPKLTATKKAMASMTAKEPTSNAYVTSGQMTGTGGDTTGSVSGHYCVSNAPTDMYADDAGSDQSRMRIAF